MRRLATAFLLYSTLPLFAFQAPHRPPSPRPTPQAQAALEGIVRGPDAKPVEGALVIAQSTADFTEPPLSTRTDAAGRFRLTPAKAVPHTLRVEAKGLAGRTVGGARPGARLEVTLAPGRVIEGIVRDGGSGRPVAGATVEARDEEALGLPWEPRAGVAETSTNARGWFRLEGLSEGLQVVRARAKGHGSGLKRSAMPGRPLEIYLFPTSTVTGTVWGPGGAPVAGAVVQAEAEDPRRPALPAAAVSDLRGHYEIASLEPGSYRLAARARGLAPALVSGVAVERGGEARADLVLDRGGRVRGRLVSAPDRAAPGRVVVQEIDGQRALASLGDLLRADAGADGRFSLKSIPFGDHVLVVTAPGYAPRRVDVHVAPASPEVDVGDVELETGLVIRGRVRDRAGQPVEGATLFALQPRIGPGPGHRAQDASGIGGAFVLAGLEPGAYRMSVFAPGYAKAERTIEAGTENVELVLTPGGSITGTVVEASGQPVGAFHVSASPARREPAEGAMIPSPAFRDVASADGRFLLEDLREGTYVVEVTAPERSRAHVSDVRVAAGATTDVGTIRLTPGGVIRGTVADATGAPVPGAAVSARGQGREFVSFGTEPQALSDPAGAFELRGVTPGTVELFATHPSYADGSVSGIEVDPARGPAEARIVLTRGGRIEGWVRRRDGSGIPGAYVSVLPQGVGGTVIVGFGGPDVLVTGADGGFRADHVPAGRASVTLMNRAGASFTSAQRRDVEVREGEVTPVEFRSRDILVSGHVTRRGVAVAGARITLSGEHVMFMSFGGSPAEVPAPAAGPQHMTAVTGEDGGYEMIVDEPGRFLASVGSADGKLSYPATRVDIPNADAHSQELAFTSATVTGAVVDNDTGQPLGRARVSVVPKQPEAGAAAGAWAVSGEDGRFQLELEPGAYLVRASADGYGAAQAETSVSEAGSEVRLALARGLSLAGTVLDGQGRGVGGLIVVASEVGEGLVPASGGFAMTLPDGTFQIGGLRSASYRVMTRSELGAFAVAAGVRPGDKGLVLKLRPGGRVRLHVTGQDGRPVEGASATAELAPSGARTDAQGRAEMIVPAGTTQIRVVKDRLEGRVSVTVTEGGTTAAELTLAPAKGGP